MGQLSRTIEHLYIRCFTAAILVSQRLGSLVQFCFSLLAGNVFHEMQLSLLFAGMTSVARLFIFSVMCIVLRLYILWSWLAASAFVTLRCFVALLFFLRMTTVVLAGGITVVRSAGEWW